MNTNHQKIVPHLWFATQALEAADFYTSVFPDSRVDHSAQLENTPSGDCDIVTFTLWGQRFEAISAGPMFTFNPAISFIINFDPLFFGICDSAKTAAMENQALVWEKLADGGTVLMPLDSYPFSERFGWVQDRYGVSWQLILSRPEGDPRPPIVPSMMFTGDNAGKAEEAVSFYQSLFENARPGGLRRYGPNQEPDKEGSIMFSDFNIENFWIAAMDSAHPHDFNFNEAVSFVVYCDDQSQIDHYWSALNATVDGGQCGWLKDRFGVSWQIVPAVMHDMLFNSSQETINRLMSAVLGMKKLNIPELEEAFNN